MFAKKYRLPAQAILKTQNTISTQYFLLKTAVNNLALNRYGFVVSKKIDKRATVRNQVKRHIRQHFEDLHEKLKQGNDLLVIAKPSVKEASPEALKAEIQNVLRKGALL